MLDTGCWIVGRCWTALVLTFSSKFVNPDLLGELALISHPTKCAILLDCWTKKTPSNMFLYDEYFFIYLIITIFALS